MLPLKKSSNSILSINSSNESAFIDRAVIRLYREYSKDELVATLSKNLKEKDIEIGKLKSAIDELEYIKSELSQEVQRLSHITKAKKQNDKTTLKDVRKEELYNLLLNRNRNLQEINNRLRKNNKELAVQISKLKPPPHCSDAT
jgi:hypothetical protein